MCFMAFMECVCLCRMIATERLLDKQPINIILDWQDTAPRLTDVLVGSLSIARAPALVFGYLLSCLSSVCVTLNRKHGTVSPEHAISDSPDLFLISYTSCQRIKKSYHFPNPWNQNHIFSTKTSCPWVRTGLSMWEAGQRPVPWSSY